MADIPPVEPSIAPSDEAARKFDQLESKILAAEFSSITKQNREVDQRYYLRWLSVILVTLIIAGMATLLYHVAHRISASRAGHVPAAYIIAVYIAPIVSMSTLAISLLIAAFRGFKDSDGPSGVSGATDAARASGFIQ